MPPVIPHYFPPQFPALPNGAWSQDTLRAHEYIAAEYSSASRLLCENNAGLNAFGLRFHVDRILHRTFPLLSALENQATGDLDEWLAEASQLLHDLALQLERVGRIEDGRHVLFDPLRYDN